MSLGSLGSKWSQSAFHWMCTSEWPKMMPNGLILTLSWQPGLRMVKNDAFFFDFERLLEAWAQNDQKWNQIVAIWSVSWQPGLTMLEHDAKLADSSVSWQSGLRMIENDAKLVDLERLLAAWAQNGRKLHQIDWVWPSLDSQGSEWWKMMPNSSILGVSWQTGLRMLENGAEFVDFDPLLAA